MGPPRRVRIRRTVRTRIRRAPRVRFLRRRRRVRLYAQLQKRGVAERILEPPRQSALLGIRRVAAAFFFFARRLQHRHAVSPLRRRRHRHLVGVLAPAGGGRRRRQQGDATVFNSVPEKLAQHARRQKVARVRARGHLPQSAELRRRQLQGFADARRVPLRHAPAQVVGRQKRVDHVQVLDGHADVRCFGARVFDAEELAHALRVARRRARSSASRTRGVRPHDGLVAVLVEHAPHELSRQKLVLADVHLIAAHSAVHQVGDQNGAVYAHRVRVPVELGERLQKRVQNL
mmetsp:Transcript_8987/g.37774  ORF Transcript_8987/g.37774 Transcript_8987/m.37774 type:complete len:289 (-) Transcript_8987:233-1099(-)